MGDPPSERGDAPPSVALIPGVSAEVALDALLRALENSGAGVTVVLGRDGRETRVYANATLAKLFGVDLETVRAMPPRSSLTKEEFARLAVEHGIDWSSTERGTALRTEIQRPDGKVVPVRMGIGYATVDGAVASFVFMRDVSAEADMEAALRDSQERFRRVAEACPDLITVIVDDRYTYGNPAALRHLGVSSIDELARIDPITTIPAHQRALAQRRAERAKSGERLPPLEIHEVDATGREVVLESTLTFTSFGGHPAFISYTRDITERVRLQAKLLAKDRLASVGMLAAGVAHELNNPLAALVMQVHRLRASPAVAALPADERESLLQIHEAATRMRHIIADLLFLSRPSDAPQSYVDLRQILASTIALLRAGSPSFPPTAVEIGDLPTIQGFASRLGQVFFNVLANAAQAVGEGSGGGIRVRAAPSGEAVEVVVEDDGPGIAPEVAARVGQPFFTTKPDGTGLGLWISQTLVAQHGGTLDLASAPGRGTAVTIRLPLALAPELASPPGSSAAYPSVLPPAGHAT